MIRILIRTRERETARSPRESHQVSETTDYSYGKRKSILGENRRQRLDAGSWSDLRNHRVGSIDQTSVLGQIS